MGSWKIGEREERKREKGKKERGVGDGVREKKGGGLMGVGVAGVV